jgi:hypothetical protein
MAEKFECRAFELGTFFHKTLNPRRKTKKNGKCYIAAFVGMDYSLQFALLACLAPPRSCSDSNRA